jgi:uncharacterized membrane protein YfcA
MAHEILENIWIRTGTLILAIGAISGQISGLIAASYPPETYPIVKLITLCLSILGLICTVGLTQSRRLVVTDEKEKAKLIAEKIADERKE